eukprot:TRINITY_DN15759_c0_g1_i9.p2 TRINITY_DN15759_c0_g1~~TRINITY_DN15759_c0_g1_i9.p2  ORF type:complete len:121 (+),score=21.46 TRINITY_DN15759_c0_g1_i9:396-758(+)
MTVHGSYNSYLALKSLTSSTSTSFAIAIRTSSVCRHVGSPLRPKRMSTSLSSSARMALSTPQPVWMEVIHICGRFPVLCVDTLSLIHISEPTRLLSISYAVFCLKKKKKKNNTQQSKKLY